MSLEIMVHLMRTCIPRHGSSVITVRGMSMVQGGGTQNLRIGKGFFLWSIQDALEHTVRCKGRWTGSVSNLRLSGNLGTVLQPSVPKLPLNLVSCARGGGTGSVSNLAGIFFFQKFYGAVGKAGR